jgi:TipAS antibiotic-recognition domain
MNTQKSTVDYLQSCRVALNSEQTQSLAETNNWEHVDKQQVHLDWDALYKELAPMIQILPPSATEIQSLIARHYAIVSRFYVPSKQAYIGMSLFYGENEDMKSFHNAYQPNMVEFLAEAMLIYSHEHLSQK